jgi:putative ABC transport system permease protein
MRYLDRTVLRELAANRNRTSVLVLALSVAFLMPAGIEMGLRSLLETRSSFAAAHRLADLEIRMVPEDLRNLPDWTRVPGLERAEERLLMPGIIQQPGAPPVNALMVFLRRTDPAINRLLLREGRALGDGPHAEAIVERSARDYHGIGVGQELRVKVGNHTYAQQIVGVAASPEFLVVAANPEYFLPEKGSLVIVYTPLERVYENIGFRMVNDLVFTFSAGADPEKTREAILAELGSRQLERIIPRDEHISWKHITLDDSVFRMFQPAIATVLAILAAGLVLVNFDRLVCRQRAELGAMKAMGYPAVALVRAYALAGVCLAAAGIAVGVPGAMAFRSAFLGIYADAHGLAHVEHHLYWPVLFQSAATVLLIAVGCALAATWRLWRTSAIALMRPLLAQAGRRGGLRPWQIPDNWPMSVRIAAGNLVRSPRLTALTVLGVSTTVSVAAAYLICVDSMQQAVLRSVDSQPWNSVVSFLHPVLDEDYRGAAAEGSGMRVEGFVRSQAILGNAAGTVAVSVLGLTPGGSLHAMNLVSGRMPEHDDEIVLGADVARRLGASTGSGLDLTIRNDRRRVDVVGIKSDVVLSETIMSLGSLQRLLEMEEQATGMFVAVDDPAAAARVERLRDLDFVGRVTGRAGLVAEFADFLQDIRQIVLLVAAIALLVAVVFITANLSMAVGEQATEFSTLWALGYTRVMAARIVLVNALVQTGLGLVLAVPLTAALALLLNALASRAWFEQTTHVSPVIPLLVAGFVIMLTVAGTKVTFGRFWRSDLLGTLRSRSIQ